MIIDVIKNVFEIIYYIAFIFLTGLIVKYSIQTYRFQTHKHSELLCKIFVRQETIENKTYRFYLEIYNFGNVVAKNIDVFLGENKFVSIDFIKPNESCYLPIGEVIKAIDFNEVTILEKVINQDENVTVKLKLQKQEMTFILGTDMLFQ